MSQVGFEEGVRWGMLKLSNPQHGHKLGALTLLVTACRKELAQKLQCTWLLRVHLTSECNGDYVLSLEFAG